MNGCHDHISVHFKYSNEYIVWHLNDGEYAIFKELVPLHSKRDFRVETKHTSKEDMVNGRTSL